MTLQDPDGKIAVLNDTARKFGMIIKKCINPTGQVFVVQETVLP